jgi:hypothetical protein
MALQEGLLGPSFENLFAEKRNLHAPFTPSTPNFTVRILPLPCYAKVAGRDSDHLRVVVVRPE